MDSTLERQPVLIVTQGDPRGIGPEIILKALDVPELYQRNRLVLVADEHVMRRAASLLGRTFHLPPVTVEEIRKDSLSHPISFLKQPISADWSDDEACGRQMGACIERGIEFCLEGHADGIATAPIEKSLLRKGGYAYDGHTEMLKERAGVDRVVMLMAGRRLKVGLVTIHVALRRVPELVNEEKVFQTIEMVRRGIINYFGQAQPRIAVAGFNPHASDNGLFGEEEEKILIPAIEKARKKNWRIEGPISPDAVFRLAADGKFDAVVAMYHDQGLIPFKMIHFSDGVNVTLGIPFIRTSPDHGVAYDIANTGAADASAMIASIRTAGEMSRAYARRQAETVF